MDNQVANDLAELEVVSISSLVRTTMLAFVSVYRRRPAFVEIYLRGRTNLAVHQFGRDHNLQVAKDLRAFAIDAGLAKENLSVKVAQLAVEVGDRVFQLAYSRGRRRRRRDGRGGHLAGDCLPRAVRDARRP